MRWCDLCTTTPAPGHLNPVQLRASKAAYATVKPLYNGFEGTGICGHCGGDHFIEGRFELFRDLGAQIQGHCNEATTVSEGHYIEVSLYYDSAQTRGSTNRETR